MSYLDENQSKRILTTTEFSQLKGLIEKDNLAIRCNQGSKYEGGDGFNLDTGKYATIEEYATALYASVCFAQDTIKSDPNLYELLLLKDCAVFQGETYTYRQGSDSYNTLPKCHGLGGDAKVVGSWSMNDSAIKLARQVVERILAG